MLAVFYAAMNLSVQVLFTGFISLHFIYQKKQSTTQHKLIWLQENNWQIYDEHGDYVEACLTPWSFLSSWLVMLVLKTDQGRRVSVLVSYDALDKESFRCLKLRLTTLKPKYLRNADADKQ